MTKQFTKGQKVKCVFGRVWTVAKQIDTTVWVYEGGKSMHSTKVVAI